MKDMRYIGPSWDEPQGGSCECQECDGHGTIHKDIGDDGTIYDEACPHCAQTGRIDEDGNPVHPQPEFEGFDHE